MGILATPGWHAVLEVECLTTSMQSTNAATSGSPHDNHLVIGDRSRPAKHQIARLHNSDSQKAHPQFLWFKTRQHEQITCYACVG